MWSGSKPPAHPAIYPVFWDGDEPGWKGQMPPFDIWVLLPSGTPTTPPGTGGGPTVVSIELSGGKSACNLNDDFALYSVFITYDDETTSTDASLVTWNIENATSADTKVAGTRFYVGADETAVYLRVTASIGVVASNAKYVVIGGSDDGGADAPLGVAGRSITVDTDGNAKWREIAMKEVDGEMCSLIVRETILDIGAKRFSTGSNVYNDSELKGHIDNWFSGMKSGNSVLYRKAMTTDAVTKVGKAATTVQEAKSFGDGFSIPLSDMAKDKAGDESWMGVAFALSYQEGVNFCSLQYTLTSTASYPSSAVPAQANWNALAGKTPSSWLRSPGPNAGVACSLYDIGVVNSGSTVSASNSSVRPALWVKSDIFAE